MFGDMRISRNYLTTIAVAMAVAVAMPMHAQSPATWTLDTKPVVALGNDPGGATDVFSVVTGATLLPNGNILVGDRAEFTMRIFTPTGKQVAQFGRKGRGPGEVSYLARLYRCGDKVFAFDIDPNQVSVFTLAGTFERTFRFSSKLSGNETPYKSACNASAHFVHYGWERNGDRKIGAYRSRVPLFITPADSSTGASLGTVAGSERWGMATGSRPLPLGKEARIAIGAQRVYAGEADDYAIRVYALNGTALPSIALGMSATRVTSKHIEAELERQVAEYGEKSRKGIERSFTTITMPKTLPSYRLFLVDRDDNLWVQDFATSAPRVITWRVFDNRGKHIAVVPMPSDLEPFEIGKDYVLGRYVDAEEAVPEVRMYRLRRGL